MAVSQVTLGFPAGVKLYQNTDLVATGDAIKASSAVLYMIEIDNSANAAEAEFVKFYNTAGAVVPGTTVPDMVILIPAAAKRAIVIPEGIAFSAGIAVLAATTGGTICTAAPTSDLIVRIVYV